jgi:hypothetical protein
LQNVAIRGNALALVRATENQNPPLSLLGKTTTLLPVKVTPRIAQGVVSNLVEVAAVDNRFR